VQDSIPERRRVRVFHFWTYFYKPVEPFFPLRFWVFIAYAFSWKIKSCNLYFDFLENPPGINLRAKGLKPNIFLSTLFSNTSYLRSSLKAKYQISFPKT
jgi:hypothetical protein